MKLLNHISIALLLTLFTLPVFAASGHYYAAGSLGVSDANISHGNVQYTFAGGDFTDFYAVNGTNAINLAASIKGGYEWANAGKMPSIALGLGFYTTPTGYDYNGLVSEAPIGDPTYLLYHYNYNINSMRLMLEAQLIWQFNQFMPFINAGVGPAWNRLNGYSEMPVNNTGFTALPPFATSTTTNLAYQVGVGVGHEFRNHDRVAVEYHFVYLGNHSFGSRGATYPYQLSLGRLTANDVFLTYTHII